MKEWPVLESHEMIRLKHVVACPIVFILFNRRYCQEGVFKVMNFFNFVQSDHFLVFLAIWAFFPIVFGQVKE